MTQPEHTDELHHIDIPEFDFQGFVDHLGIRYATYTAPDGSTAEISEYGLRAAEAQPNLLTLLQDLGPYTRQSQLMLGTAGEPEIAALGLQKREDLAWGGLHLEPRDSSLEVILKMSREPSSEYPFYGLNRLHRTLAAHDQSSERLVFDAAVQRARFALPNGRSLIIMERVMLEPLRHTFMRQFRNPDADQELLGVINQRLTAMLSPAERVLLNDIEQYHNLIGALDNPQRPDLSVNARGRVTIIDNPFVLLPEHLAAVKQAMDEIEQQP